MMTVRNTTLLVLLLGWMVPCLGQQAGKSGAEALRADIDEWLFPYRSEKREQFAEWFDDMLHAPGSGYSHPLYRHIREFVDGNQERYIDVRRASLHRYQPAPTEFPGYTPVAVGQLVPDTETLDEMLVYIQDLSHIRTLDVGDTRIIVSLLSSPIIKHFNSDQEMSLANIADRLSSGNLLFADEVDAYRWNVTLVNRLYTLQYRWDIRTNHIDGLEVLVNLDDRQEPGWLADYSFAGETPRLQLLSDIIAFRWNVYDQGFYGARDADMQAFIDQHRSAYVRVREHTLAGLPAPRADWRKGYVEEDTNVVDELRIALGIRVEDGKRGLYPDISLMEFGGGDELFGSFQLHVSMKEGAGNNDDAVISWLTGNDIYARQTGSNEWEVVGFSGRYALQYRWNIATDEISCFTCWRKE